MRKLKAITIFEVLIYLALFGVIFVAIVQFVIAVRDSNSMAEYRSELEKVNIYTMNHLNSSFSVANDISDADSVFLADEGKIRLILSSKFVEYYLDEGVLYYNDNGTVHNITNPDYIINRLYFEKIENNDGELKGIRCNLEIVSIKASNVVKNVTTSFILK